MSKIILTKSQKNQITNTLLSSTSYSSFTQTYSSSYSDKIYDCMCEINERLNKKKWCDGESFHDEPVYVNDNSGLLTFERVFGEEIYERKEPNRTIKLDKYLIDIIDDVLTKYAIKQFVCEGLKCRVYVILIEYIRKVMVNGIVTNVFE